MSAKAVVMLAAIGGIGLLIAGSAKKAKANPIGHDLPGTDPIPPAPVPAPPLTGVPHDDPHTGVIVVPDDGEPEDHPPVIVAPVPPTVPIALPPLVPVPSAPPPPPPPPPPPTNAPTGPVPVPVPFDPGTVHVEFPPHAPPVVTVPPAVTDVLEQAGIPVVKPPAPAPAPLPEPATPPVTNLPEVVITPSPEHAAAEAPTALHDDTAAVLTRMLAEESTAKWKHVDEALKPWQTARGLKADGQFGQKSAFAMASETGLLPIIRYWPQAAQKATAVPAYRTKLLELAATAEEPRASQLRAAAQREQGQGFGSKQSPITPIIHLTPNA